MQIPERNELFHERALAERFAFVRLLLALATFPVVYIGGTAERIATQQLVAAALLFAYALLAWVLVWRRLVRLDYYQLVSPFFDIALSSLLIVTTGGFLSPFHLWMMFSVAGTGFSRYRLLPMATILAALVCQTLIAQIPQGKTVGPDFLMRTLFLLGVGAVIAFLGAYLSQQSKTLAQLDKTGQLLAKSLSEEDAGRVFLWQAAAILDLTYGRLVLGDHSTFEVGGTLGPEAKHRRAWKVKVGEDVFGELLGERAAPFGRREETLAHLLIERGASTLKRIRLADELVSSAARDERSRIADRLHDTYLQTLAALDMRAEAARHIAGEKNPKLLEELTEIKKVARDAAAQAREVIQGVTKPLPLGRERIEYIMRDRWRGQFEVKMDPDIRLSDGQWMSLEMMLREGLNNAKKHGGASKVVFTVYRMGDRIVGRLRDNGRGAGEVIALGYGLQRLRMFLNEQGGMLRLENDTEGGAALVAEIWTGGKTA